MKKLTFKIIFTLIAITIFCLPICSQVENGSITIDKTFSSKNDIEKKELNDTPENKEDNIKNSQSWVNEPIRVLSESGLLEIPDWVEYDAFVSQQDFSIMLSRVTRIKDRSIFGDLDQKGINKKVSRALAIDSALRAFGFSSQMEKATKQYKSKFIDIFPSHPYYQAALTAEILKLSAGYPDGTFRPDDNLNWAESIAIIESVYKWSSLLPLQTPIQKAEDMRQHLWYYFLDAFRLLLTLAYCILSIVLLGKAWKRAQNDRTGLKQIIKSLMFAIIFLFIMWINEVLFSRDLIDKKIYYLISTISVLAGIFLIRVSNLIHKKTQPKPKASVDVGCVDFVDINRGEIFVTDSVTKKRVLAMISDKTKVYSKENKLLGPAFFTEISQGDVVSLRGVEEIGGGSVIDVSTLLILAAKQESQVLNTRKVNQAQVKYDQVNNSSFLDDLS